MKRQLMGTGCAGLIALAFTAILGGQVGQQAIPAADDESTNLWFVELSSPPAADGTSLATVRAEKAAFRRAAAAAGLRYQERYAFDTLWNGLSVRIDRSQVGLLSKISGVKGIYPVAVVDAPEPREIDGAEFATALAMTGADVAQNTLGFTGAGVRVAVMDTGIDYHHPDLGGCFGPGCRVATGWDFVGDDYNSSKDPVPDPVPDPDPDDCGGHGTHVAGIVGADGEVTGVAPGVTFGAYRVFGCEGTTTADIMIAAMERVLADNMQVLNMSIGSSFQWPQYPTAQASDRLVNKGVSVVASIGNAGGNGLYSTSAPGVGQKVIGVASFDNTFAFLPFFTITPDDQEISFFRATGAPAPPTSGDLPFTATGTPTSAADACAPQNLGDLTGKVALIRRGTCSFYEKARRAELAGASAVVLYNNAGGYISPTVAVPTTPPIPADGQLVTIPVVAILATDGSLIYNRLQTGPVTLTWTDQLKQFPLPTAGLISSFSSYGLSPDLALKPDIAAPGGFIRSTYPLELGGQAALSGTSMASPHTAGAVALLLEARPNTSAQAVRTILQNSADPRVWWGNPGLGFLDNVHRQGAGMLDVPGAIQATTKIEPSKLSLGESEAGPAVNTLTIRNQAATDVTYDLSHVGALSTGANTFTPSFATGFASVAFSVLGVPISSIVVPAGGTATVDVTITANAALANRSQYGGYIVFTPQGSGAVYRVPYAGFKGDYQSIQVLVPTPAGFPLLARLTDDSFVIPTPPATYTFVEDDIPYFLVHLDHQSRRLKFEVFEAASDVSWYTAIEEEYLPRNSGPTGFFAFGWDGKTSAGKKIYTVPDGQYVMRLSVLKALGDPANPAHWETWTSPAFNIDRP